VSLAALYALCLHLVGLASEPAAEVLAASPSATTAETPTTPSATSSDSPPETEDLSISNGF
jgi:hypothetical protein